MFEPQNRKPYIFFYGFVGFVNGWWYLHGGNTYRFFKNDNVNVIINITGRISTFTHDVS